MQQGGPLYTKNNIHSWENGHICIPVWLCGSCGISEELSVLGDCIHNVLYFLEDLQKNISCIYNNMAVY
jgi:hypothetical protein